jgi:hypothetical protein
MNIYQRIILVAGAMALVILLSTTPKVFQINGALLRVKENSTLAPITPLSDALVRALGVLGATALLWFAASSLRDK